MVKSLLFATPALTYGWQPYLWGLFIALALLCLLAILAPLWKVPLAHKKGVLFLFIPVFMLSCLYLYERWGASEQLAQRAAIEDIRAQVEKLGDDKTLTPDKALSHFASLEKKIAFSDAALAHLGDLYIEIGLVDKAVNVFTKALALAPDNEEYWQQWAYSHSLANQGKLPLEVRTAVLQYMQKATSSKALINLLAIDDYFQKKYPQAVAAWQWLLSNDDQLTEERRQALRNAIAAAREQEPELQKTAIKVNVTLAAALRPQVKGDEVVFIFVKSPHQRAPLAVVKKRAEEIPFTVYLGDEHSMLPGVPLSTTEEVKIVAKISSSGDPLDKAGDLRGESGKLMVKSDRAVSVVIDQVATK